MIDLREDDLGVLQRVENEAMKILRATGYAPPSYPLPPQKKKIHKKTLLFFYNKKLLNT